MGDVSMSQRQWGKRRDQGGAEARGDDVRGMDEGRRGRGSACVSL